MFMLPRATLALAGVALVCVAPVASARPISVPFAWTQQGNDQFASSGRSPAGRYDPALTLPGSSRDAVNKCIHASELKAARYGKVNGVDVARVGRMPNGYDVRGTLLFKRASRSRNLLVGFTCLTRNHVVGSIRLTAL
jgi:hypothetical protein